MERPEVRIVEPQIEETSPRNISDWERNQLLVKYGYHNSLEQNFPLPSYDFDQTRDLSYAELMRLEDLKVQREIERKRLEMINRPNPFTFDVDQVKYSETRWSNSDDSNIGFEVRVVSDMKIPNRY